jgi:translation initiation factor 3 subunit M
MKVQELVDYVVRGRSDEEREAAVRPFAEAIKTDESQKPFGEDYDRRRHVFTQLLSEVKGLGDGTEKGVDRVMYTITHI